MQMKPNSMNMQLRTMDKPSKDWLRGSFLLVSVLTFAAVVGLVSCQEDELLPYRGKSDFAARLSEYHIYTGNPADLEPAPPYTVYELTSALFTDYAEKQRLVKVPAGTALEATGDGLLRFPEGTILVKTFYYYYDKRYPAKGKRLIETRLLHLEEGTWHAATYRWNATQTDAYLFTAGSDLTVNWIADGGKARVIAYRIPSNRACATCHHRDKVLVPLGPKVRNLNREVQRGGRLLNQLTHLQEQQVLLPLDPATFGRLPAYEDTTFSLEQRARAYLDMNCAHCHSEQGYAASSRYRMSYETSLDKSKIRKGKESIEYLMKKGLMPKIGTTVVDEPGLALIQQYLKTL